MSKYIDFLTPLFVWNINKIKGLITFLILIVDSVISSFHSNLEKLASNTERLLYSSYYASTISYSTALEFS